MQGMGKNMNFRFTPIYPFSIHPDEAISVSHCGHKQFLKTKKIKNIISIKKANVSPSNQSNR
jgi:hypothetical protein